MNKELEKLINSYKAGEKYLANNSDIAIVDRQGFQLIIPSGNTEEYGIYLINSIKGHDCYSYNEISKDIYTVLRGTGTFVIEDKIVAVKAGDKITILPKQEFYYKGEMLMTLEMSPDFKEGMDHVTKVVTYESERER